jgi:acetolactate synthase-1/3 small subunit
MSARQTGTVLHTLSVLVENKAGVLARVSNLFARRGYNIYSLAVAPTDDPSLSRITVVVDVEPELLEQVVKQLHKLINVIKISELDPGDSVERELMLVTVRAEPSRRHQIIELADVFGGRIEALAELLAPYGVVSMQRTGRVALPKLERTPPVGLRVAG